ncbi:hypothetical protein D3C81_1952590 [compost metagenome]
MMVYKMYCNKIDEKPPLAIMEVVDDADEIDAHEEHLTLGEPSEVFDEEKWLENLEKLENFIENEDIQVIEPEDASIDEGVEFVLAGIERKVDTSLKKNFEDNNFISGDIEVERNEEAI